MSKVANGVMGTSTRHYMNPLHVYCRMRDIGIAKGAAKLLCRVYERSIYRHFLVAKGTVR